MKSVVYLFVSVVCSVLFAFISAGDTGLVSKSLVLSFLLPPIGVMVFIDSLQYFLKKYVYKAPVKNILSKENAIGIVENYFVYWLILGVLRTLILFFTT
jgi:hypothetical protein